MKYYLIVFLIGVLLLIYGFASTNTESEFEGAKLKDTSSLPYLISGFLLILGAWALYDASDKKIKHVKEHETYHQEN